MSTPQHPHGDAGGEPASHIEWTGERMVPWAPDLQVVYEHLHRYALAAQLAHGARVLDLACGEGYGASLLADAAKEVVGVDIAPDSVAHARSTYDLANVRFEVGSIVDTGLLDGEDGTFDVVTCFEAIEHVDDHDAVIANVRRLLRPGGLFVVSTPDKATYTDELGQQNPFHVHEMTADELSELLGGSFVNVELLGQIVVAGSLIAHPELKGAAPQVFAVDEEPGSALGWAVADEIHFPYFVALASDDQLPEAPAASVLTDVGLLAIRGAERARQSIESQYRALGHRAADLEQTRDHALQRAARLESRSADLEVLEQAIVVKALRGYRGLVERGLPTGSKRRQAYGSALRVARSVARKLRTREVDAGPALPRSEQPMVSIVIPVHGAWEITQQCLLSLEGIGVPAEVIVVDDASPDDTRAQLTAFRAVNIVALEENVGFLRACNAGIDAARGEHVLLLNNDTIVQPGSVERLVATMQSDSTIGVVGAKLIYPDGTLQEAGGIVWRDGSGWNVGRGGDAGAPEFNHPREVDYCSGAALLVRRSLLTELGGLDERFAPAYYEDTDLCFAARERGLKVVYEPGAVVAHLEGASHGSDETAGVKKHQAINRRRFAEKWAEALERQWPNDPSFVLVARERTAKGRVFVADHVVPTHDRDGGSLRMFRLLRLLRHLGYAVTFLPVDRDLREPYTQDVLDLGIDVIGPDADVGGLLEALTPQLVGIVLSRRLVAWQLVDPVQERAPGVPIIYDTVDLHFIREEHEAALEGTTEAAERARIGRERELSLMRIANSTWVVSFDELELVRAHVPEADVHVVPNVHDAAPTLARFGDRSGLLLVANWSHVPNVDGLKWFLDEILAPLRAGLPEVELHVVGPGLPDALVEQLHDADSRLTVHGWVADLRPLYERTRLAIAPLRYGAGMKGKVAEALACGVPVVTTSVGIAGMDRAVRELAFVTDDAPAFAAVVVEAYDDEQRWEAIHVAGPAAVDSAYGGAAVASTLDRVLGAVSPHPG